MPDDNLTFIHGDAMSKQSAQYDALMIAIDKLRSVNLVERCPQLGLPLPEAVFNKMAGPEMVIMWRWLVDYLAANNLNGLQANVTASRAVCPDLHSVADWLKLSRNGQGVR